MRLTGFFQAIARLAMVMGGATLLYESFSIKRWGWDIHDWAYQRRPIMAVDTHIVIVDIGRMDRTRLASLLSRLRTAQPAFIGIDAIFPEPLSQEGDSAWQAALCDTGQKVPIALACSLDTQYPLEAAPPVRKSLPYFASCVEEAFANLVLYEGIAPRTVRECLLYTVAGQDTHYSLALRAATAVDSTLRSELFRWKGIQPIRFRGNIDHFYYLSGEEVLRDTLPLEWLRGKVVLLGVADPLYHTMEDIFLTPLNSTSSQRGLPDMYGVVIHANITSMLLHRWYYTPISAIWVIAAAGTWYLVFLLITAQLRAGALRWSVVRLLQGLSLWGSIELILWLCVKGYWVPFEPFLWAVLIAGEVELGRKSGK